MNNSDHNSKSLETRFWVKIPKFSMRIRDGKNSDPGWKKLGSWINIPDPHHCLGVTIFSLAAASR